MNALQMLADVSDHKLETLTHEQLKNLVKDLRNEARAEVHEESKYITPVHA